MSPESMKMDAARAAMKYVENGMRLGIGTGSTAEAFVHCLAEAVQNGLEIIGVPTSERTARLCIELGVPLSSLEETPQLDLTIDGADEIDPALNLIKGGGGALLREKIVAFASRKMVVIADESKMVPQLGAFALPIEINQFGMGSTLLAIEGLITDMGLQVPLKMRLMRDEALFVTDGGHYIVDASFGHIHQPEALSEALARIPGIVETGLFIGMADMVIIAGTHGTREISR